MAEPESNNRLKGEKLMQVKNKSSRRKAFTIVELLTVMSIIIILIGLLVPALNQVKRYAKEVKQHAQFHSIDVAMELYETEHDGYPPSDQFGSDAQEYCGAMKLAEAMVGQDLSGFHLDSVFRSDLQDATDTDYLYAIPGVAQSITDAEEETNRQSRKGPYLGIENANATRMDEIYGTFGVFGGNMNKRFVLCDEYSRTMNATGVKAGMPILYFRANLSGTVNPNKDNGYAANYAGRIYLYEDNDDLLKLEAPWTSGVGHPMYSLFTWVAPATGPAGPKQTFYWRINNDEILLTSGRPWRADSYLLLSAGFDGLYGTRDDIYNFQE
jgi:type II secretory pathway pseudopilin PulG